MPTITTNTGTFISQTTANTMVGNWVSNQAANSQIVNSSNPKSLAFGASKVFDILRQTDCIGIRIYNGMNNGNKNLIIIGIDSNEDDMTSGLILDFAEPCPSVCPTNALH